MSIVINDLHKSYGKTDVLKGLNLSIAQGSQIAIKGASGSGKSTLLYLIGGLDRADKGIISVDEKQINRLDDDSLALYRNSYIGFVFQFHFLLPSMTCLDNVLLSARLGGKDIPTVTSRVVKLAKDLGVEHCMKKYPFELSGGEQQRVNLIRALSLKPKLLLCDEPTGNLDTANSQLVTRLIKELSEEYKATTIVVTHDNNVASQFAQVIHMTDGMIQS
jgi:lipoprotein-releasing system ATP-binding protein